MFRLASADLVDQHRFCAPHRCGCLEKLHTAAIRIGIREPDQVVERDEAGVVVAMLDPESFAKGIEEERFTGAGLADQQQRILGDHRRQNDRFKGIEAADGTGGMWVFYDPRQNVFGGADVSWSGWPVTDAKLRAGRINETWSPSLPRFLPRTSALQPGTATAGKPMV